MARLMDRAKAAGSDILDRVWPNLYPAGPPGPPSLPEALEQARKEWLQARAFFDVVSDPDLVDYAVYSVQAAERKYAYLLRQARQAHGAGAGPAAWPASPGLLARPQS